MGAYLTSWTNITTSSGECQSATCLPSSKSVHDTPHSDTVLTLQPETPGASVTPVLPIADRVVLDDQGVEERGQHQAASCGVASSPAFPEPVESDRGGCHLVGCELCPQIGQPLVLSAVLRLVDVTPLALFSRP